MKLIMIVSLLMMAYWDLKKGWIYAGIIWGYLLFCVVLAVGQDKHWMELLFGILPGIMMLVMAFLTKEKLVGKADGGILLALGLVYQQSIWMLLFLSSLLAIILMKIKKQNQIPMIPLLFLSVIIQEGWYIFE